MKTALLILLASAIAAAQSLTIDAGAPSDQYFVGGTLYADSTMSPDTTLRYGVNATGFAYSIPIQNGFYTASLYISDPNKTAKGQRLFTVWANGQNLITVDPFAAGAIDKQHQAKIDLLVFVQAGTLRLDFKPILSNPLVSSIVITPWLPSTLDSYFVGASLQPGAIVKGSVKVGPYYVDAFTVAHDDDPNIVTKCVPAAGQCPAAVQRLTNQASNTGGPCAQPADGVAVYVKLPDDSCLPLVGVPAAGLVAQPLAFQWMRVASTGEPEQQIVQTWISLRAAPGSNLIPNATGTAFIASK